MKNELKNLKAAIAAHAAAVEQHEDIGTELATKSDRLDFLKADGGEGDVEEVMRLNAEVALLPGRIQSAERRAGEAMAGIVRAAEIGLRALQPWIAGEDKRIKAAAVKAVTPFCVDRNEVVAVVERFSAVRAANHLHRELSGGLASGNPGEAISRIADLLKQVGTAKG
jgi:hypothetical protein